MERKPCKSRLLQRPNMERKKTKKAEGNAGETGKIYSDLLIFRRKLVKLIPAKTLSGQIEEKQIKSCEYARQRASS